MNVKKLKMILSKLKPLIEKSIPVLENIVLEPGKISFSNLMVNVEFACDCNATGMICLSDLLKTLNSLDNNDDIRFENDMDSMDKTISILVNGEVIANVAFDDPADFPKKMAEGQEFNQKLGKIDQAKLGYLQEALKYASSDPLRPAMTNIYIQDQIVSTDGHVMYFKDLQEPLEMIRFDQDFEKVSDYKIMELNDREVKSHFPNYVKVKNFWYKPKDKKALLIPAELVKLLTSIVLNEASIAACYKYESKIPDIPISIGNGILIYAQVHLPGMKITFRVLEDKFPDYKNVIPQSQFRNNKVKSQSNEVVLTFNKKELSKWLKVGLTYANKTTHQIKISIKENEVKLQADDLDFSKSYSKVLNAKVDKFQFIENDKFIEKIGFNGKLLLDLVNDAKGPNVEIWINAPNRAAIIDGYMLIMPIMLNEYV